MCGCVHVRRGIKLDVHFNVGSRTKTYAHSSSHCVCILSLTFTPYSNSDLFKVSYFLVHSKEIIIVGRSLWLKRGWIVRPKLFRGWARYGQVPTLSVPAKLIYFDGILHARFISLKCNFNQKLY